MLGENLRRQLGYLLWLERAKQNKDIKWVAGQARMSILSVDYLEHGKGHFNWKLYERIMALYGKEVQMTLVDKGKEE